MKDHHVILRLANRRGMLDHVPFVQYWRVRYEIGTSRIRQLTLTMPRREDNGIIHPSEPIEMNVDAFLNGRGFSNADIKRWIEYMHWGNGALLLFKVSFKRNHLDYKLIGRVDEL